MQIGLIAADIEHTENIVFPDLKRLLGPVAGLPVHMPHLGADSMQMQIKMPGQGVGEPAAYQKHLAFGVMQQIDDGGQLIIRDSREGMPDIVTDFLRHPVGIDIPRDPGARAAGFFFAERRGQPLLQVFSKPRLKIGKAGKPQFWKL